MKMFKFDSKIRVGEALPDFDEKTVKDETMFFSCTPEFAYYNGGPITRAFLLAALGEPFQLGWSNPYWGYSSFCFDSRVHMLMPGWWPCIPGWHHDDVPRSRGDGQPNYEDPEYRSKHILGLVNGDICPTQFAIGKIAYPEVPEFGPNVYEVWNELVDQDVKDSSLKVVDAPSNRLIYFDCDSFHRGQQCNTKGWRWFGRLTYDADYGPGKRLQQNEIRRQVNVYMNEPMKGW